MTTLQIVALALLAPIAVVGAWLDVSQRRLPNWLCAVALVFGIAVSYLAGGWVGLVFALAHAVLALLVGMALFAVRVIGGGDAKFYAALAVWFPIQQGLFLLVSVACAGLFLAIAILMRRRKPRRPANGLVGPDDDDFRKVPYGVAIAAGALLTRALLAV